MERASERSLEERRIRPQKETKRERERGERWREGRRYEHEDRGENERVECKHDENGIQLNIRSFFGPINSETTAKQDKRPVNTHFAIHRPLNSNNFSFHVRIKVV